MKAIFTIFLFCLWISPLLSQPVFLSTDYAQPGDSFLVSTGSVLLAAQLDFQSTGPNHFWDYSSLEFTVQRFRKIDHPNQTGFRATYLFNCNFQCYDTCYTNCMQGGGFAPICASSCNFNCLVTCNNRWNNNFKLAETQNDTLNLGIFSLNNIYNFYDISANALEQVAIGSRVSGLPLLIEFEKYDRLLKFPVQFGDSDFSESAFLFRLDTGFAGLPFSFGLKRGQNRTTEINGWGTLVTPFGVFDSTLRLSSVIALRDTIFFNDDTLTLQQFLPNQIIPDTIVEAKWLSKESGIPLLEVVWWRIAGVDILQNIVYPDSARCHTPFAVFGYLPIPTVLDQTTGTVDVNFFNLSLNIDSFFWNFGDTASGPLNYSGSINPMHTYSAPGTYTVRLSACNTACFPPECTAFQLPVLVLGSLPDTTGIFSNKPKTEGIFVFPNPVHDAFNVQMPATFPGEYSGILQIFNIVGELIIEIPFQGEKLIRVDTKTWENGVYILSFSDGKQVSYHKLVKH